MSRVLSVLMLCCIETICRGVMGQPSVLTQRMSTRSIELGHIGSADVAVFEVQFDEPLKLQTHPLTAPNSFTAYDTSLQDQTALNVDTANTHYFAFREWPGIATLTCTSPDTGTDVVYRSAFCRTDDVVDNFNDDYDYSVQLPLGRIFSLPAIHEPALGFAMMLGAPSLGHDWKNDTVAFGLVLSRTNLTTTTNGTAGLTIANINKWGCRLNFPDYESTGCFRRIYGSNTGMEFNGTTDVFDSLYVPVPSTGDILDIIGTTRVLETLWESRVSHEEGSRQMNLYRGMLSMYAAYGSLAGVLDSGVKHVSNVTVSHDLTAGCPFAFGSDDYATSPACNYTLRFVSCPAGGSVQSLHPTFAESKTLGSCWHPAAIASMLPNWLTIKTRAAVQASRPDNDPFSDYQSMSHILDDILAGSYGNGATPACYHHAACASGWCDKRSASCMLDRSRPEMGIAKLMELRMSLDFKEELGRKWKFDPYSPDFQTTVANYIRANYVHRTCLVQNNMFGDIGEVDVDPNNADANTLAAVIYRPYTGDCTGFGQSCSAWDSICNDHLQTVEVGDFFCGFKFSSAAGQTVYEEISTPAQCVATSYTDNSADCLKSNATGGGRMFITAQGYAWQTPFPLRGHCIRPSLNTVSTCLSSPVCATRVTYINERVASNTHSPFSGAHDLGACGLDLCYFTVAASITKPQCLALQATSATGKNGALIATLNWLDDEQMCVSVFNPTVFPVPHERNQTVCDSAAVAMGKTGLFIFQEGRTFLPGQWDTPEKCAVGRCDIPEMSYSGVNQSRCEAEPTCTRSCGRCTSSLMDAWSHEKKYCVSGTVQSDCLSPGNWTGAFCSQPYGQQTCTTKGYTFYSCADITERDACNAAGSSASASHIPYGNLADNLACRWFQEADCGITTDCDAAGSGECTGIISRPVYSCAVDGTCANPAGRCVSRRQVSPITNTLELCTSSDGGTMEYGEFCVDTTATQTSCAAKGPGWTWTLAPQNAAECAAAGQGCNDPGWTGGGLSLLPSADCLACGGNITGPYLWLKSLPRRGHQQNTTWVHRSQITTGQFNLTINEPLLHHDLRLIAGSAVSQRVMNDYYAGIASKLGVLQAVALDCNKNVPISKISFAPDFMKLCRCRGSPSKPFDCQCPGAQITSSPAVANIIGTSVAVNLKGASFALDLNSLAGQLTGQVQSIMPPHGVDFTVTVVPPALLSASESIQVAVPTCVTYFSPYSNLPLLTATPVAACATQQPGCVQLRNGAYTCMPSDEMEQINPETAQMDWEPDYSVYGSNSTRAGRFLDPIPGCRQLIPKSNLTAYNKYCDSNPAIPMCVAALTAANKAVWLCNHNQTNVFSPVGSDAIASEDLYAPARLALYASNLKEKGWLPASLNTRTRPTGYIQGLLYDVGAYFRLLWGRIRGGSSDPWHPASVEAEVRRGAVAFTSSDVAAPPTVYNQYALPVGQVLGKCVNVPHTSDLIYPVHICVDIDPSVNITSRDNSFPVYDFAPLVTCGNSVAGTMCVAHPLGGDLSPQSGKLCSTVSQAAAYCPVRRYILFDSATPGNSPPAAADSPNGDLIMSILLGLVGLIVIGMLVGMGWYYCKKPVSYTPIASRA